MPVALLWFRRDLRLVDHPALLAAVDAAGPDGSVLPVFVFDDRLWRPSGEPRRRFLLDCLADLGHQIGGALVLRSGDPAAVLPALVRETGATSVHVSADPGPYGRIRDAAVERALGSIEPGVPLVRTGSPYAVTPGRVTKRDGTPFQVFSPFARAWREHGWRAPAPRPAAVPWLGGIDSEDPRTASTDASLPPAGEAAAAAAWRRFRDERLLDYDTGRNVPGGDGTSRLSAYLKYGCIHPRTLLADVAAIPGESARRYADELAWREFYADVLWHRPDSAREYLKPELKAMAYDEGPDAEQLLRAWEQGRTGFPIVDAGMRQLHAEAYVHNRVRMIVASFLVKDLHQEWTVGARYFLQHLVDGDLASNQHGWQWVAGTGTDASPYYRVFNPVTQGKKFDPDGTYVKRWVPEVRDVDSRYVHEPWTAPGGVPAGYPEPIVDHAHERLVALDRYQRLKAR